MVSPVMLRRSAIVFLSLFIISIIFVVHLYIRNKPLPTLYTTTTTPSPKTTITCAEKPSWLLNLTAITYPVKYARRDIIVNPKPDVQRDSITKIDGPLFPEPQVINLAESLDVELERCEKPLILDVPLFDKDPVDASHIIFGMTTTLDRLEESIQFLERWLAYTRAKLFVIAASPDDHTPADPKRMGEVESRMQDLGLNVSIIDAVDKKDFFAQRYFSLAKVMYSNRDSNTQWISFIDDDTFFPSMHSLVSMLDTKDTKEQFYIGALSEDWWSVQRYGLMAFGGAGIFLSTPLAAVIDTNYQDCKDSSGSTAGDIRVMECIYRHTNTKLTHVPGLYQIDIGGDLSGLFESGRLALSLHHWKTGWWDDEGYGSIFPMAKMHLVADICGDCFMQRWQFGPDMIVSNGFSIATYPKGHLTDPKKLVNLDKMEKTFFYREVPTESVNKGIDHYVGPGRPKLELEKEKIQYRFLDAIAVEGGVRQFYIHPGVDGELSTLFEIFWSQRKESNT